MSYFPVMGQKYGRPEREKHEHKGGQTK